MKPIIMDFSGIYREENFLKEEKTVVSKACLFEMQTLFLKSGAGLQEHLWEGQCCVTMLSEHE